MYVYIYVNMYTYIYTEDRSWIGRAQFYFGHNQVG